MDVTDPAEPKYLAHIPGERGGKVRLLRRDELSANWNRTGESRLTIWKVTQHLIRAFETEGATGTAALMRAVGVLGEVARDPGYRLYTICERKKWSQDALVYTSLVIAWPEIARLAGQSSTQMPEGFF